MNKKVQLFVKPVGYDNFVEVDLSNDESIVIEDKIQDVKDITKIYSLYAHEFNIPASKTNNNIFGHYYNNFLTDFDARIKVMAILKINGSDFRRGFISLSKGTMLSKYNPSTYKVSFSESTASLKSVLKDYKIQDLDHSAYVHENTTENRVKGIREGLYKENIGVEYDADGYALYPDIIYAPIFDKGKAVPIPFSDADRGLNENSTPPADQNYNFYLGYASYPNYVPDGVSHEFSGEYYPRPVAHTDYKPSIKISAILNMMNNDYKLGLTDEFIYREELDQLYLWYNKEQKIVDDNDISFAFNDDVGFNVDSNYINLAQDASAANTFDAQEYSQFVHDNGGMVPIWTVSGSLTREEYSAYRTRLKLFLNKGTYDGEVDIHVNMIMKKTDNSVVSLWKTTLKNVSDENEDGTDSAVTVSYKDDESDGVQLEELWHNREAGDELSFIVRVVSADALAGEASLKIRIGYPDQHGSKLRYDDYKRSDYYSLYTNSKIVFDKLAPDMKLIDFLTSLFKMFNLTAYFNSDKELVVETLDEYYASGDITDLSRYVDMTNPDIAKALEYKDCIFEFEDSKDVMSEQYSSINDGSGYPDKHLTFKEATGITAGYEDGEDEVDGGDITESVGALSTGKNLKIESKFSCMMFERAYTAWSDDSSSPTTNGEFKSDNTITDMVIGNAIDSKMEKGGLKNLIFYGKQVNTEANFTYRNETLDRITDLGGKETTQGGVTYYEHGNTAGMYGKMLGNEYGSDLAYRGYILVDADVLPDVGAADDGNHSNDVGVFKVDYLSYDETVNGVTTTTSIGGFDYNLWWNPSNTMASRFRRDGSYMNKYGKFQGLQFGNDTTEEYEYYQYGYYSQEEVSFQGFPKKKWVNGLYDTYYKTYLGRLYNERSRIYSVQAVLPDSFLSSYSLKDTVVVDNRKFKINKMSTNLLTGESKMELLTDISEEYSGATINEGAFSTVNIDGANVEFSLDSIQIPGDTFPDEITIYTDEGLNTTNYTIQLISTDFEYVSSGLYKIKSGVLTTGSWATCPSSDKCQYAYAILKNLDGSNTNKSNTVNFTNQVDVVSPTVDSFSVANTDATSVWVTFSASDNIAVTSVTIKKNTNISGSGGTIVSEFAYDGSSTIHMIDGFSAPYTTNIAIQVSDAAGNTSAWSVDSASATSSDDSKAPAQPDLTGEVTGGTQVTLTGTNMYDNVNVTKMDVYKSSDGGNSWNTLGTTNVTPGDYTDTYVDNAVVEDSTYKYYIKTRDAQDNTSVASDTITVTVTGGIA